MRFIHTIPSGGSLGPGTPVAGTILGVASLRDGHAFDNQALVDAGIAGIELPADMENVEPWDLIGTILSTPLSAGFSGGTTFTDQADFTANSTPLPAKYRKPSSPNPAWRPIFYDGASYFRNGEPVSALGEPLTLTITNAGLGYTSGSGKSTFTITGNGTGLTVQITSVGGNGEITGVSVTDGGYGYDVGDTIKVIDGDGSAVLTVGSLVELKIGEINSGRGASNQASANDINPTYFVTTPMGYPADQLQLVIPSSGQILSYNASGLPAPYEFDSLGDCFTGGDYRVQVQVVATGTILSEYVCPGPQDVNSDIDLAPYS